MIEASHLQRIPWDILIVDEGDSTFSSHSPSKVIESKIQKRNCIKHFKSLEFRAS